MRFRPCIDIHNGKVKQIVGGSLRDADNSASENYVSERDATWFASLYREHGLAGGHVILLNPPSSDYYEETLAQGKAALAAFPEGLQIGGGVSPENAADLIEAGASHVIVTSYVFRDGKIEWDRLLALVAAVGRDRLVLDLSCRRRGDAYYIVTDRWQRWTDVVVSEELLGELAEHCDEFLIHAADVEGRQSGIDEPLVRLLAGAAQSLPEARPITYAGGISSIEDVELLEKLGCGRLDFTIGSSLDLFGGMVSFSAVLARESAV